MKCKYKHIMVRKEKSSYSCWGRYSKHRLGTFRTMGGHWFYESWGDAGDCDCQATVRRVAEWTEIGDFLNQLNRKGKK